MLDSKALVLLVLAGSVHAQTIDGQASSATASALATAPALAGPALMLSRLVKRDPTVAVCRSITDGQVRALVGQLSDPMSGPLEEAARTFVAEYGAVVGIPYEAKLTLAEQQDGTPVTLVRFQPDVGEPMPETEVEVAFDKERRVIGLSAPGMLPHPNAAAPAAAPPRFESALQQIGDSAGMTEDTSAEVVAVSDADGHVETRTRCLLQTEEPRGSYRAVFKEDGSLESVQSVEESACGNVYTDTPEMTIGRVDLAHLTSHDQLTGSYAETRHGSDRAQADDGGNFLFDAFNTVPLPGGDSARIDNLDFLEVNTYYHLEQTPAAVSGYDADRMNFQIPTNLVDTPGDPGLWDNAIYDPASQSIRFFQRNRRHFAADNSVISHEYGHAVLARLTADPELMEGRSINEGFADYVAFLTTGKTAVGDLAFPLDSRDVANHTPYDPAIQEPHAGGQTFAGLAHDVHQRFGRELGRDLVFAGIQLAPRPLTYRSVALGLLMAERFFSDRTAGKGGVLDLIRARGLPVGVK